MTAISTGAQPVRDEGRGPAGGWAARLLRGRPTDPAWARPALLALLAATALLYLAGLSRNGWANDFYAAAVQAGATSWKAFLFGSFDSANFITVDKTPASLWVMELSVRVFGLNYWSLLVPQALEGVATVGVLYTTVRRWFGARPLHHRRRRHGPHPGRHADVPVQQPRLAAGAGHGARRLHHHPGPRVGPDPVARPDRSAARAGFPDQDAAGIPGAAGLRARLPGGGPAPARPADLAAAGRRCRAAGRRGLVGGARHADPGRRPPLHRRLHQQQHSAADVRLQRVRPARRERGRLGRVRERHRAAVRRLGQPHPAVRRRDGRPGQLADPGRAGRAGRAAVAVAALAAHGPDPLRRDPVGRLAGADRPGVQLYVRHHPPLLHRRAGARGRGADRHRRRRAVAGPAYRVRPRGHGGHAGGDGRLGLGAARPQPGLVPVAAGGHPGRRPGLGGGDPGPAAPARGAGGRRAGADCSWPRFRCRSPWPPGWAGPWPTASTRRPRRTPARCPRRARRSPPGSGPAGSGPAAGRRVRQQVPRGGRRPIPRRRRDRRRRGGTGRIRRGIHRPGGSPAGRPAAASSRAASGAGRAVPAGSRAGSAAAGSEVAAASAATPRSAARSPRFSRPAPRATRGPRPRSARRAPPRSSSPPASRCWRSAASTAPTPRPPWPSSSGSSPSTRSTTSWARTGPASAAGPAPPRISPRGSRLTSPRKPSAASPSTTWPPPAASSCRAGPPVRPGPPRRRRQPPAVSAASFCSTISPSIWIWISSLTTSLPSRIALKLRPKSFLLILVVAL